MTYLSADPSENECLLRDDTPCSYAPLLRMRTKYFNHHVRSKYLLRSKILNEVWERDVHLALSLITCCDVTTSAAALAQVFEPRA